MEKEKDLHSKIDHKIKKSSRSTVLLLSLLVAFSHSKFFVRIASFCLLINLQNISTFPGILKQISLSFHGYLGWLRQENKA